MEQGLSAFLVPLALLAFSSLLLHLLRRKVSNLPPGPPGWPIFGNLFDLDSMPHRKLASFRPEYGDVIWLRMGAVKTMVILSAKAATEFFKNHDLTFADRAIRETMRAHGYEKGSVALAPYGSYWRTLRRLVTTDMLVNRRLNESAAIRRKSVDQMVRWVEDESGRVGEGRGVRIGKLVFLSSFNLLGNLMLSRDLVDPKSEESSELFAAVTSLMQWSGHANIAPILSQITSPYSGLREASLRWGIESRSNKLPKMGQPGGPGGRLETLQRRRWRRREENARRARGTRKAERPCSMTD